MALVGVFIDSGSKISQYVLSLSHLPSIATFTFEPVSHNPNWLQKCSLRCREWLVEVVLLVLGAYQQELKIRLAGGKSTLRQYWYIN